MSPRQTWWRGILQVGIFLALAAPAAPAADRAPAGKPGAAKKLHVGQRHGESDEQYTKRRDLLVKRSEKDKDGLYTLRTQPFIIRTDISADFTADTALFMEMLHREYGKTYAKMGLPQGPAKEWIEVVVYADRATYMRTGGSAGSGGQFMQAIRFTDRPPTWSATHYRLAMFTDGETEFAKWEKGTLQHEAAHMELQLRLGFLVDSPRWFNEGQASCFENWDFDKTVDENLAAIPRRGRYAPVIRRAAGTDKLKPFSYVWEIDAASWHAAMTDSQGGLNYSMAWSLAAYMLNEGKTGRKAFRTVYGLSKRVGADRQISATGTKTRAWQNEFPAPEQKKLEHEWIAWIDRCLPKEKANPDERDGLINMGYDPDENELVPLTKERWEKLKPGKAGKKKADDAGKGGGKSDAKKKPPADDESGGGPIEG
ncbi:MAG: hypothetical protein U1A27_00875 [Phycisphaerae bacterium]